MNLHRLLLAYGRYNRTFSYKPLTSIGRVPDSAHGAYLRIASAEYAYLAVGPDWVRVALARNGWRRLPNTHLYYSEGDT